MSIKIIKPGVLTTLQDVGRYGYRSIGIGPGGAMDVFAMMVSNFLVGNDESSTVMEINYPGPQILFQQDALISLTGADLFATVNDTALPLWKPFFIQQGALLKFIQPMQGARAYLSVKGGWGSEEWLGSCSTHLKVCAGGHSGRALQKGDIILFKEKQLFINTEKNFNWHISGNEREKIYQSQGIMRCIKGVEWNLLNENSKQEFESNDLIITSKSDRMGYRLSGHLLSLHQPIELISSAVDAGTIQLLPDGNLIVLMADHQTTGGYPRIASVIKADLPQLAQITPGQKIRFSTISLKEAEEALISMMKTLSEIKFGCHLNLKKYSGT